MSIGLAMLEIQLFKNFTLKIQGESQGQSQNIWLHLRPGVKIICSFLVWIIVGWDIADSIFDLENSRSNSWPRSKPMVTFDVWNSIDMFAFCFVTIRDIAIPYLTLKIQGEGHCQGQTWWSHLRHRVQSICLLFGPWQSDRFGLRSSKFHI